LCSEAMSASNIPPHVLTGCEHNSGFYGASKTVIADRLEKSKEAQHLLLLLSACGTYLSVTQEVISDLEQFGICYVYGDAKSRTLRDARAVKWGAQKKKSTIQLVPDSDSLRLHLDRTNYVAYLPKHYHVQSHPSSIGQPWNLLNGPCVLTSSTQPHFPSMPLHTKPEAEKNSDGNGKRVDSDSNSCSSYSDSDNDGDAIDMY